MRIGQLHAHAQGTAGGIGLRQHGSDGAFDALPRHGRQARCSSLPYAYPCALRLRHGDFQPDAVQAIDPRQRRTGRKAHALTHVQLLQHASNGGGDGDRSTDLSTAFKLADGRGWHSGQAQPLAGGLQQCRFANTAQRQIFLLRGRPLGNQQIGQRGALVEQITRRMMVDALDEATRPGLNHCHVARVVFEYANRFDLAGQLPARD